MFFFICMSYVSKLVRKLYTNLELNFRPRDKWTSLNILDHFNFFLVKYGRRNLRITLLLSAATISLNGKLGKQTILRKIWATLTLPWTNILNACFVKNGLWLDFLPYFWSNHFKRLEMSQLKVNKKELV